MYIFFLALTVILFSGCSVEKTPPVHSVTPYFEPVSRQTNKIPIVIIVNDTDYYFETLLEDLGRGVIIHPHKTNIISIPNIKRGQSQIKIRVIALEETPYMDERHMVGEIERQFPIPDKAGSPIPIWIINNNAFK